jgi:Leucine-rich repeat (LRR) protein
VFAAAEEEEEDHSYVGFIELPSLTYLNFSDNSLEQIPRELNLASCTRIKKARSPN